MFGVVASDKTEVPLILWVSDNGIKDVVGESKSSIVRLIVDDKVISVDTSVTTSEVPNTDDSPEPADELVDELKVVSSDRVVTKLEAEDNKPVLEAVAKSVRVVLVCSFCEVESWTSEVPSVGDVSSSDVSATVMVFVGFEPVDVVTWEVVVSATAEIMVPVSVVGKDVC